ncbi:hypothetical protein TrVFT333_004532 [Trichoderma virens FT-333]|nr:hypothetical protein TrVFT333_004532 [Trichoderma virens FT-333]
MSTPAWNGCTIRTKSDGGFEIISPTGAPLLETADSVKTTQKPRGPQRVPTTVIRDDDLVQFEVLGRCRFLANGVDKLNSLKANKGGQRDWTRLKEELKAKPLRGSSTTAQAAYLGFAMDMRGPVFMRKETPKTPRGQQPIEGRVHPGVNCNNLKGIVTKSEPAQTMTGQAVIPHYLLTVPANLKAAKKLVSGAPLEECWTTPQAQVHYTYTTDRLIENIEKGKVLTPPAVVSPTPPPNIKPGMSLAGLRQNPAEPEGPTNKPLSEVLYVMDHSDMRMERWMQVRRSEGGAYQAVPEIFLAAGIVYTPHYLRFPEYMGLSEFPHPFRFIYRALETDQAYLGESIKMTDIDQGLVMDLMKKVTSRIPGLSALDVMKIKPWMMPGSKMPPMFGEGVYPIDKVQLALTGLENVRLYGLDDYGRPAESKGNTPLMERARNPSIGMVKILRPKYVNETTPLQGRPVPMPTVSSPGLFLPPDCMFPLWKQNKARGSADPVSMHSVSPSQWTIAPMGWTEWDCQLENYVPGPAMCARAEAARRHYEQLTEEGYIAVLKSDMIVGPNLLWMPRDWEPVKLADITRAPPRVIFGPESRRYSRTPSEPRHRSVSYAPEGDESPALVVIPDSPNYGPLLEAWSKVPERAHWAWKDGLERLKALPVGGRSDSILRQLKSDTYGEEVKDHKIIQERLGAITELTGVSDQDITVTLPEAFGRMLGLAPATGPLPDLWSLHYLSQARKDKERQPEALLISSILGYLKDGKYRPESVPELLPLIQESVNDLLALLVANQIHCQKWMGDQWANYNAPESIVLDP